MDCGPLRAMLGGLVRRDPRTTPTLQGDSNMNGIFSTHYESWPCDFCLKEHPAYARSGTSFLGPKAYCPELGAYVYSREALRSHVGRCP